MKTFDSVEKLIEYLDNVDKKLPGYYARYPGRFIFFYNNLDYQNFVTNLNARNNVKLVELTESSPFTHNEDSWLTPSSIIRDVIANLDPTHDVILTPLSEVLRFFPDDQFRCTISSFFEIENTDESQFRRRIYIPFLGLKNRFLNVFWRNYRRQREGEPCLEVNGDEQRLKIYIPLFKLKKGSEKCISCSKEFLEIWKIENPPKEIVCKSDTIRNVVSFSYNDECFEIETLKDIKEYFEKCNSIEIPIEYVSGEEIYWQQLFEEFERNNNIKTFKDLAENFLNVKKIDQNELLTLWYNQQTNFGRWLIKNYFLAFNDNNESYAYKIFKFITSYDSMSLIKEYWFKIFELDSPQKYSDERILAIKNFYSKLKIEIPFEEELKIKLNSILEKNPNNIEIYLTGVAFCEKKFIIEHLDLINDIKKVFKGLDYYLDTIELESSLIWINQYFNEYRISKVRNKPSDDLINILNDINESKNKFYEWYYSFPKVEKFLLNERVKIFMIDALGLEFLPLILNLLRDKGFEVKFDIARANIPSITEMNKIEGADILSDLDDLIHSEYYEYPDTLIKEIEILEKLIDSITLKANKFIITSDHGLTAFATKNLKGKKMYEFDNVSHEGRCVFLDINSEFEDETEFLRHEIEINGKRLFSLVPLKHTSLSEIPKRESHGGVTPEEILIPVIYASKVETENVESTFEINPISLEINIREPYFKFKIMPETYSLPCVYCLNKKLNTYYDNEEKIYKTECKGLKKGEHRIIVKIEGVTEEFIINIKGGLQERDII